MATESKCTLNNIYQSVLSVADEDSNNFYSPLIFDRHFNAVTSFLISELVKVYPYSQDHIDMLNPFVRFGKIPVSNGFLTLPEDYRNMLGNPAISIRPDGKECGEAIKIDTEAEFKAETLRKGCQTRPLIIVPKSEWDERTTSTYNYPTLNDPICQFIGSTDTGKKQLQVCPYDISTVYLLYCKMEKIYTMGYIKQPDDTFLFDKSTTIESEWGSNAFTPILNGVLSLYSAYAKDTELTQYSQILSKSGIL